MNENLQSAADIEACRSLVLSYCVNSDFGLNFKAAECFEQNGELLLAGKLFRGRTAIRTRLDERPAGQISRHFCSCPFIELAGTDLARGVTYVQLYRSEGSYPGPVSLPLVAGYYRDEFSRSEGRWLLRFRELTWDFATLP